jgi:hypothetical protein
MDIEYELTKSTNDESSEEPRSVPDHLDKVDRSGQPKQHDEDDRRNRRRVVVVKDVGGVVGHSCGSLNILKVE